MVKAPVQIYNTGVLAFVFNGQISWDIYIWPLELELEFIQPPYGTKASAAG